MSEREWVLSILRDIYQPTPSEAIWEWAERCLVMPGGGENTEMAGQRWTSLKSPYVREIMDWFRQPGKGELIICKSSQVGITMSVLIVICWHIRHRPMNIGYYIDSVTEARNISKTRLKRWILDNKILDEIGEDKNDLSNLTYTLRAMVVYMLGSFSEGAYRNKALSIAILDELDAHPPLDEQGTSLDGARARVKKDKNSKLIAFSTPKLEKDQTWTEYLTGTQEKYYVPCPCCNHVQPLVWSGVQYSGVEFQDLAGEMDLAAVKAGAWYKCEMGCRIEHDQKHDMLQKGEWRATNPKAIPGKRSMHLSDLYSAFTTWGDMAVQWIEAQTNIDKLRAFIQQKLGEPFRQEAGELKEKDILACRERYPRGTVPVVPVLIALLCDVQQSTVKWTIVAFDSSGNLYLVDWGETASWDTVAEISQKNIETPNGPMPIECGLVDEGDGNRTKEVRTFTQGFDHLFPCKGRGERQIKELVWPSFSYLGNDEVLTYHVNDHVFKSELLFERIRSGEKRKAYGGARLILCKDVSPEFVAELMNERLEKHKNKYRLWEQKWVKSGPNDYLDCLKYALALWTIMEPSLRAVGRIKNNDTAA